LISGRQGTHIAMTARAVRPPADQICTPNKRGGSTLGSYSANKNNAGGWAKLLETRAGLELIQFQSLLSPGVPPAGRPSSTQTISGAGRLG
jgi:hypothetical protein